MLPLPQALRYYGGTAGPHQAQAAELHQQLRRNLLTNIVGQYSSTGYLWEQYDDATGALRPLRCAGCMLPAGWHASVICSCLFKFESTLFFPIAVYASAGQGKGSHPFTGWTALLALLAADQ